jgi:hypothetical protein
MIDPTEIAESIEGGGDAALEDAPRETAPEPASPNGHLPRLSLDDIVAANDLAEDTIDVPEWGGSLQVRAMTKQRQLEIRNEAAAQGDRNLAELLMFTACVVEPEMTSAAVSVLRGKSAAVFDRVMRRILELNGADAGAVERAKARFPAGAEPPL